MIVTRQQFTDCFEHAKFCRETLFGTSYDLYRRPREATPGPVLLSTTIAA